MEFEQIMQLIREVSNSELTRFCLQEEGFSLSMRKEEQKKQPILMGELPQRTELQRDVQGEVTEKAPERESSSLEKAGTPVTSPLVGIFYRSASPEAEPYVKVGDHVTKGQVLGIVEAMKLMNEIESEFTGKVKEILAENESMVEYGQTLFIIEEEEK